MARNPLENNRLASILGASQQLSKPAERITTLPVSELTPGAQQPRRSFKEEQLAELAQSIHERGILQPLLVRPISGGGYEIVAGERRWRAAQLAGLSEVPVILRNFSDQEAAMVALIENVQRENLNVIDEIDSKIRLIGYALDLPEEQVPGKLNELRRNPVPEQVEILETVFRPLGEKWSSFARNKLRILNYPPHLVEALRRGLALTMVTLIARAPIEHQMELIRRAENGEGRKTIAQVIAELSRDTERLPTFERRLGAALTDQKWLDGLNHAQSQALKSWLTNMPEVLRDAFEEASKKT